MNELYQATKLKKGHIESLDGVRALAVVLVMTVHYHEEFGGGWIGVQLFFVLSGFLITGILLDAKVNARHIADFLKVFWMRRALRIFPLYLAFLLIGELCWSLMNVPQTWPVARPWLWTYTLNFGHIFNVVPVSDVYSHFWSLAVEEQFYLVWPFLIWFLDRESLRRLVIAMLVLAPLLRWILVARGIATTQQLYFLTPTLLDSFAAGAALVLFDLQWIKRARWWLLAATAITISMGIIANLPDGLHFSLWSLGYPYFMPRAWQYVWGYSALNFVAALLLLACVRDEVKVFAMRPIVALGKISYGVYVIHRPVYRIITAIEPWLVTYVSPFLLRFLNILIFVVGSIALAAFSYRYYETPLLKLKRFFTHANQQQF